MAVLERNPSRSDTNDVMFFISGASSVWDRTNRRRRPIALPSTTSGSHTRDQQSVPAVRQGDGIRNVRRDQARPERLALISAAEGLSVLRPA